MEALIVSDSIHQAWALPSLLARAGFSVDAIVTAPLLRLSRFTRNVHVVDRTASLADAARRHVAARARPYDWVIATDDLTLRALAELERGDGPPSLLPLRTGRGRGHIYTKIGLSEALAAGGIRTPPFRVARGCGEAISAARAIGYPVLLKVDSSSGGEGVHECRRDVDIAALGHLFGAPLLVQKKIAGREYDLSAIFLDGNLVHFNYAAIERTSKPFGLSVLRTYRPLAQVDAAVFGELARLGSVLDANGFVTISCIDARDGSGRHYFEADMRPNVWADFSLYYGEDAAARIRDWFARGTRLTRENAGPPAPVPASLTLPYFLRLPLLELLINRYGVWKFIPLIDAPLVLRLLVRKVLTEFGKWMTPVAYRRPLRDRLVRWGILAN